MIHDSKRQGKDIYPFTLDEIIAATRGTIIKGQGIKGTNRYTGVSIDTRTIKEKELFIAIRGRQMDGHKFINEAVAKRAGGIVLSDMNYWNSLSSSNSDMGALRGCDVIHVYDTTRALQEIAYLNRSRFNIPVIAATGSNGKTTVKDMIHRILSSKMNVLKTKGNQNNLIGVPLTLLNLDASHNAIVVEMGMNAYGEIRREAEIARPTIGVINNISEAHTEFLADINGVITAKGELIEVMDRDRDSIIILNRDDHNVMRLKDKVKGRIFTFGVNNKYADIFATDIIDRGIKGTSFQLNYNGDSKKAETRLLGLHSISNIMAASAVAVMLDFKLDEIVEIIKEFVSPSGRMEAKFTDDGIGVIDDTYNSNPCSLEAAIDVLAKMDCKGKKAIVMGDMLELGAISDSMHLKIGKKIASLSIDILLVLGERAGLTANEAIKTGMDKKNIFFCNDHNEAVSIIKANLSKGDLILIKGSRGMKMEIVVEGLYQEKA